MIDTRSSELATALLAGATEWELVQRELDGIVEIVGVDFRSANLSGHNLHSIKFIGCKFELFNFNDLNIENCFFFDSTFTRSSFSNTRILNTMFHNCVLNDCTLSSLLISNGKWGDTRIMGGAHSDLLFVELDILNSVFDKLTLDSSEFQKCKITDFHLMNLLSDVLTLTECLLSKFQIINSEISVFGLNNSRIDFSNFENSTTSRFEMFQSTLKNIEFCDFVPDEIDMTRSLVEDSDLTKIPIERAVLSKSTFRNCSWPNQIGTITWYGLFRGAPRLLSHPIRDVEGIDQSFRSSIAEQQFLHYLSASAAKRPLQKFAFLLWGIFTDYGRSLFRFAIFCFLAITVFSVLQIYSCSSAVELNDTTILLHLYDAFIYKTQIFLGFPIPSNDSVDSCFSNYNFPMRLIGFLSMGLWIGLAANKLGLLSGIRG